MHLFLFSTTIDVNRSCSATIINICLVCFPHSVRTRHRRQFTTYRQRWIACARALLHALKHGKSQFTNLQFAATAADGVSHTVIFNDLPMDRARHCRWYNNNKSYTRYAYARAIHYSLSHHIIHCWSNAKMIAKRNADGDGNDQNIRHC